MAEIEDRPPATHAISRTGEAAPPDRSGAVDRRRFGAGLVGLAGAAAFAPSLAAAQLRGQASLRINGQRLTEQLSALAEFGRNPEGGVSRVAYSEADRQGREYVLGLMREAGLEVHIDAAANMVGRRAGRDPSLPPLGLGSHIDSVPMGGNYDGPVGALAAIEAARTLMERKIVTRHPLEVLIFSNEESGKTGSRVLDGQFKPAELELKVGDKTIAEGLRFLGGDPDRLAEARRAHGSMAAFLELHIEQGGILDAEGLDIGVVEGIVGIKRWSVVVDGFANHAGTTAMDQRRDALLAGARFVDAVNRMARATPGRHVATVGRLLAEPGAPNVIAGRATAVLEIRDLDLARVDALFADIRAATDAIGAETGTTFTLEQIYETRPALADAGVQQAIERSAKAMGLTTRSLPSGAGHDAQDMASLGPMGMIFVPSKGGISHSPQEHTEPEQIVRGADVLLQTLLGLDAELDPARRR